MVIEYDVEADAAFIWLVPPIDTELRAFQREVWPPEFEGNVGLLVSSEGKLIGLEVLHAADYLDPSLLREQELGQP